MHEPVDTSLASFDISREFISPIAQHESHSFSTTVALNPLVAAAMPLLSVASHIDYFMRTEKCESLLCSLLHEVKAFESNAFKNNYRSPIILAARYLLCTLIDEQINLRYPGTVWEKQNLLLAFQRESYGGERFFIILQRCCEEPDVYIDLLELGYLCLSLGFQGKYKNTQQLGLFIDQLYQIIQQVRSTRSHHLLERPAKNQHKSNWHLPPWWVMALSTIVLLFSIFIPYTHSLDHITMPLMNTIDHYEK